MLTHTFCHLPGVGPRTEQALWRAGVTGWDAVLRPAGALPRGVRPGWVAHLEESARHPAPGNQAHIDLRYPLRSLGYTGGLKGCERQLGVARPGLEDVDGYLAVLLWDEYRRRKNERALETLLAYNAHDTVNLAALMVHAYNGKV